jgi:predicted aldo/keto reductase-like oxidoreductase
MERRELLSAATVVLAGAAMTRQAHAEATPKKAGPRVGQQGPGAPDAQLPPLPRAKTAGTLRGEMLYRQLGKTGVEVSAIGLGGWHIGVKKLSEEESVRLIRQALDRGMNFLDNSWDYHDGRSEQLMGKALAQGYRQKAFVMSKIDARTKDLARKQIDESLSRLKVDHIDLMQHHEVIRFDDADRIFAEGGAHEAMLEAKKAGKIRFIGFTGHKDPQIHLYAIEVAKRSGYVFDAAQLPLNLMDAHYRSFSRLVVPRLVEDGTAVLGMKSLCGGDGIILKSGAVSATECINYALNLPTATVICGIDKQEILEQAFTVAKAFKPMSEAAVAALIAKTQRLAMRGEYELFKTTAHFDATARHAEWLGDDPPAAKKLLPARG